MKTSFFPEPKVLNFIREIEKIIPPCSVTESSFEAKKPNDMQAVRHVWRWQFQLKNSQIVLDISVGYPGFLINVVIENNAQIDQTKTSQQFFFERYLKHINAKEDLAVINDIVQKKSWGNDWITYFGILIKHLNGGLGNILKGSDWPNILFDINDYLEPSAADKLYDDVKNVIF